ncbi:MAG: GNAT family N-acetyltransferase, partial [Planctomycetes bacterium]|nr:GNAT family N-acetyltransferase [Planctomycetota bacterium]
MILRPAVEADIAELHRVRLSVRENRLSRPDRVQPADYRRLLAAEGAGWAAVRDGRIVGFSMGDLGRAHLWALFVEPGHEH